MSLLNDIEAAFGQHLGGASIAPIVEDSGDTNLPSKPYLEFQHVPTTNQNISTDGSGGEVQRGYFMVTVVTQFGKFSTQANGLADDVKDRFPMGLALDVGTRKLRISRPAQHLPGFRDEADWRAPVRIGYIVTGQ